MKTKEEQTLKEEIERLRIFDKTDKNRVGANRHSKYQQIKRLQAELKGYTQAKREVLEEVMKIIDSIVDNCVYGKFQKCEKCEGLLELKKKLEELGK